MSPNWRPWALNTSATGAGWARSSRCVSSGCLEVRILPDGVLLRNSKAQSGLVLECTLEEWTAFVEGVRAGEFDVEVRGEEAPAG